MWEIVKTGLINLLMDLAVVAVAAIAIPQVAIVGGIETFLLISFFLFLGRMGSWVFILLLVDLSIPITALGWQWVEAVLFALILLLLFSTHILGIWLAWHIVAGFYISGWETFIVVCAVLAVCHLRSPLLP